MPAPDSEAPFGLPPVPPRTRRRPPRSLRAVQAHPVVFLVLAGVAVAAMLAITGWQAKKRVEHALLDYSHQLAQLRQSITEFDSDTARQSLDAARADLDAAHAARGEAGFRMAALLPGLKGAPQSLDGFLSASEQLYSAAERGTHVLELING